MICRALMILLVIISLPILSILQIPPKVMAQGPPSEVAKVLVDDTGDTNRAQIHLKILDQQIPFGL